MKATRVQTVAFGAKCNHKRALYRRLITWLGTVMWGTFLGTYGSLFSRSIRKTEGTREKATVSLTVVFLNDPLALQPENRARKSANACHQRLVLIGTRRIWTATRTMPPITYAKCGRPRVRQS